MGFWDFLNDDTSATDTAQKTTTETPPVENRGLLDFIAKEPDVVDREAVKRICREHREVKKLYVGGLASELETLRKHHKRAASKVRALRCRAIGRRIDLVGVLKQFTADGKPMWALADPIHKLSSEPRNGVVKLLRDTAWYTPGPGNVNHGKDLNFREYERERTYLAAGMPPLPPSIRELATDNRIRRHASMVAVLFKPDNWTELPSPNVDPALVVQWMDIPNDYYALAVWGQDRPGIMEFVE